MCGPQCRVAGQAPCREIGLYFAPGFGGQAQSHPHAIVCDMDVETIMIAVRVERDRPYARAIHSLGFATHEDIGLVHHAYARFAEAGLLAESLSIALNTNGGWGQHL